eukprot:TRINITY_DN61458_c0_g1_i1.p1 TRINITY_DN61458_c0_g1~~TRINITY_DN61458_c0_g1_i1.p1  ORF type:complete len:432 (-),score=57.39 TRINITY_DN61458_c0_g1_i1:52-1347(-)
MAAMWSCRLCNQRNAASTDRCITCGRPSDWRPSPRPSEPSEAPLTPPPEFATCRQHGGEIVLAGQHRPLQPSELDHPSLHPPARSAVQLVIDFLVSLLNFLLGLLWPVCLLRMDEQLRVQHFTSVTVTNGPGLTFVNPFKASAVEKAVTLGVLDYVRIRDTVDGSERAVHGPRMLFLGPYEIVEGRGQGVSLSSMQYVLVEDKRSGERRVQRGPAVWIPGPREEGRVLDGVRLSSTEYVSVEDTLTGEKTVHRGPCIWFPGPYEEHRQGQSIWLSGTDYVTVQDTLSGERRVDKGPCVWFPGPYEEWEKGTSISLTCTQYITVLNRLTGRSSMVKGPCIWFPGPYDKPSAVNNAIVLQDDEYVKLKDVSTGTRWVHRGKGLLFLEPTWHVESSTDQSSGIQKSWALKGREFLRLQVAPHLRLTKGGSDGPP